MAFTRSRVRTPSGPPTFSLYNSPTHTPRQVALTYDRSVDCNRSCNRRRRVDLGGRVAEVAADVDLAFLDAALGLPRRFFSVRWEGFLYVVSPLVVDFWAGADNEVTLTLDGRRLLERNPVAGMHSVLRTARLTPGLHTLGIEYAQAGGGSYLNAQWAPSGRRPESLGSLFVFPNRPDDTQIATATRLSAIRNVAALLWIGVPFVIALLVGLPAAVRFASRRLATGGPPATPVIKTRGVPWLRWVDRHPGACLTVVLAAGW